MTLICPAGGTIIKKMSKKQSYLKKVGDVTFPIFSVFGNFSTVFRIFSKISHFPIKIKLLKINSVVTTFSRYLGLFKMRAFSLHIFENGFAFALPYFITRCDAQNNPYQG